MFHELVVSQIQVVRGRHMWDGAVALVKTGQGNLEVWKSGENGGGTEGWYARLYLGQAGRPTITALVALAETYGLQRGDCTSTSRVPNPIFEAGEIVGFEWKYFPSTN